MLKALLLIAHGSPRHEANDEFVRLADRVRQRADDTLVAHAFLGSAKPDIPHAIDELEKKGVKEITILPFFLVHGLHTSEDIPRLVDDKRKAYPGVAFNILEPIGAWPEITEIIIKTGIRFPSP